MGPTSEARPPTAVQIAIVYNYLGFMILPLYVAFDRIDVRLREASKDLGAGRMSTFFSVTLPLAAVERPTLEQIATEPLVTYHPTFTGRTRIDQAFARERLKLAQDFDREIASGILGRTTQGLVRLTEDAKMRLEQARGLHRQRRGARHDVAA